MLYMPVKFDDEHYIIFNKSKAYVVDGLTGVVNVSMKATVDENAIKLIQQDASKIYRFYPESSSASLPIEQFLKWGV